MSTIEPNFNDPGTPPPPDRPERRRWPRFPDKSRSRVWFSTAVRGAQYGQLENISLGGVSIHVLDASQLEPGARIVIGLDEWMIPATVRHVQRDGSTGYRVGMEWVRTGSAAVTGLVSRYQQAAEMASTEPASDSPDRQAALAAQN